MQQRVVSPSQSGNLTIELFAVAGSSSCLKGSYENPRDIHGMPLEFGNVYDLIPMPNFYAKVAPTKNYFDRVVFNLANAYLKSKAQSSTDLYLKNALNGLLLEVSKVLSEVSKCDQSTLPMLKNAETELNDAYEASEMKVKVIIDKFVNNPNIASDGSPEEVMSALREIACYYSSLSGPFWQYIAEYYWADVLEDVMQRPRNPKNMDAWKAEYRAFCDVETSIIHTALGLLRKSTLWTVWNAYKSNDVIGPAKFVDMIYDCFLKLADDCSWININSRDLLKLFVDKYSSASLGCMGERKKKKERDRFVHNLPDDFLTFENSKTELIDAYQASEKKVKDIIEKLMNNPNIASDGSPEEVMGAVHELNDATDGFLNEVINPLHNPNIASDGSHEELMGPVHEFNHATDELLEVINPLRDVVLVKCSSWYESLFSTILRLRLEMMICPLLTLTFKGTFIKKESSEIAEIISISPDCGEDDCGHLRSNWKERKVCISWKTPTCCPTASR